MSCFIEFADYFEMWGKKKSLAEKNNKIDERNVDRTYTELISFFRGGNNSLQIMLNYQNLLLIFLV